ncbi:MAG: ABC transporter substrate-binding protein [Mogibacterium sp.]|uniref:ABC transporter substrate-binding protein n=1 Tax=Mogibacterium sp. TaxID=2049035 RepID=UPI001A57CFD7|nr:ABC transporter substrate-binding protein [Mogibacterium sp.]MBL6469019.1 ABC transporter substrate-binding protein [Mogibacterium sp.]
MNRMQLRRGFPGIRGLVLLLILAVMLSGCNNPSDTRGEKAQSCEVTMTGGSGRASVESPADVTEKNGAHRVKLVWSSSYYDYMVVDGRKYMNEAKVGDNSVFTIPFEEYDEEFEVIGDTTAMSEPHEIKYRITVHAPGTSSGKNKSAEAKTAGSEGVKRGNITRAPEISGLKYRGRQKLEAAKEFTLDRYEKDGKTYTLLTLGAKDLFLLIPEGAKAPKNLAKNITPLPLPLQNTYVVSTAAMDPIRQIGGLTGVGYTGTRANGWHVKGIAKMVKSGKIQYAGRYSAPDYELLRGKGCDLAIENTMIYHSPAAKEKLESLGIPVMVERSSYEKSPLGRLEWVKLYGALYGKSEAADKFFEKEAARIRKVSEKKRTGKTVAVFAVNSGGSVTVRASGDYLAAMIRQSGGKYLAAEKASEESMRSTLNIQMEDFYRIAKNGDVLIYNSTIEEPIETVAQLKKKSPLLKKFKAVREGRVYCLPPGFFQNSTKSADFMEDMNRVLKGEDRSLKVLKKIEK